MDIGATQGRMAAYLRENHEKVLSRWSELVVAGVRGRLSPEEVRRELDDLYSLIIRVMSEADDHAAGELRAALDELSRARARNGFTPSETAAGVFSLKEAVYELVADAADMVPEYLVFSRMVDDLGLHTFETYSTEREQHLLKTVTAARLLGAECTISGIRPQVAQTIVALGIEFGEIATKATLADALALAPRRAGLRIGPA